MDSEEGSKDQDIKWIRPEEYYDGFQKGRQEEAEHWRSIVENLTALILDQHSPKAKEAEAGEPGGTHPETVICADPECPVPAQAGERSDFWRNLSRFYDQESIRRATAAEVKAGIWGQEVEAVRKPTGDSHSTDWVDRQSWYQAKKAGAGKLDLSRTKLPDAAAEARRPPSHPALWAQGCLAWLALAALFALAGGGAVLALAGLVAAGGGW